MLSLDISAIALEVPNIAVQKSKLGTMMPRAYSHLFDPAGDFSRPPTVRRGVTTMWSPAYDARVAKNEVRASDLASIAATSLSKELPDQAQRVAATIHTQCTLDQQILGSNCMRIGQECFDRASEVVTVGQMGTAGLPTALRLIESYSTEAGTLFAITAADKWIAPFYRRFGDLTYSDCGGCVLIGHDLEQPLATISNISTLVRPSLEDPWNACSGQVNSFLENLAVDSILELLKESSNIDTNEVFILGDECGSTVHKKVSQRTGLSNLTSQTDSEEQTHSSSASLLVSLNSAIDYAEKNQKEITVAIWTASLSGHSGAILVKCFPSSQQIKHDWVSIPDAGLH